ncbi:MULTISPECIES: F0F1 ATP synthase subunit B [Megasphaera]|uniref:ATP synthase subunit b n=1 Tax=Megasphaera hutchinsoni TaxID=1588748 RepID=A0A134CHN4_9FIRM|nr:MULTISPECIES: F0F1 ATP synthase subunit B [Megasphaera]EGS32280.1 ATP synthase F0, B subunit [Megasphaera sp. UPII 135-E]KXB91711.1 ATP synthase F0, B subunit [Megasphaera hutchinsoni]MUP48512.1 ATP synthase F0 subunit B [Veillonellaceae bacterium M2-8]MUP58454.1 ATP synthase F0 subunit B [Veillonellaceae bacterium M2-4]
MVDINGTLIFQFVNFIVLVLILAKFAYKPLLKVMEERRERIETDLHEAAQAKEDAAQLKADYEQQLRDARAQAQAIVDKAVKVADQEAQAHVQAIREQIAREKEIAQAEIVNEREIALKQMRQEVVTLSMAVAEKLLHKHIDDDVNAKWVSDYLDTLPKQTKES